MSSTKLRIEAIRAKDLDSFIRDYSADAEGQVISPISVYRAVSQATNPCAGSDDVGLLVAYIGETCVGYQGLLPGLLRTRCGTAKVYWCTAAYVLPEFRKQMVAIQLIKKVLALKQDVVVTGFDGVVGNVFKGMHFQELPPLHYLRIRMERLNLPARFMARISEKTGFIRKEVRPESYRSSWLYNGLKKGYYAIASGTRGHKIGREWREADSRAICTSHFGRKQCGTYFERTPEVIRWMLEYPWIQTQSVTSPPYYFSEACPEFRYVAFVSPEKPDAASVAVLSLSRENNIARVKLLDYDDAEEKRAEIFALVFKEAKKFQADEVEMPIEMESAAKSFKFSSIVLERPKRRYLYHAFAPNSPLGVSAGDLRLSFCDGDSAFT